MAVRWLTWLSCSEGCLHCDECTRACRVKPWLFCGFLAAQPLSNEAEDSHRRNEQHQVVELGQKSAVGIDRLQS